MLSVFSLLIARLFVALVTELTAGDGRGFQECSATLPGESSIPSSDTIANWSEFLPSPLSWLVLSRARTSAALVSRLIGCASDTSKPSPVDGFTSATEGHARQSNRITFNLPSQETPLLLHSGSIIFRVLREPAFFDVRAFGFISSRNIIASRSLRI